MKILVVEDSDMTRATLARLLSRAGHVVDLAADGPDAVVKLAAGPYDLVLLDMYLTPAMSGWDVAQHIADLGLPTKIVIVSGVPVEEIRLRSAIGKNPLARVAFLVPKPFDTHALLKIVHALSITEPVTIS